jgi:hypothetical protein
MVERSLRMREARGSIPRTSTISLLTFCFVVFLLKSCMAICIVHILSNLASTWNQFNKNATELGVKFLMYSKY